MASLGGMKLTPGVIPEGGCRSTKPSSNAIWAAGRGLLPVKAGGSGER